MAILVASGPELGYPARVYVGNNASDGGLGVSLAAWGLLAVALLLVGDRAPELSYGVLGLSALYLVLTRSGQVAGFIGQLTRGLAAPLEA